MISLVVIWTFRGILLPFVVGMVLAYILNPLVNLVERTRLNRGWSAAIVLLIVLSIIVGLMIVVVPLVYQHRSIRAWGKVIKQITGHPKNKVK